MKAGLNSLAKNGTAWPPSAPEFRKMCIGENEHRRYRAADERDQKRIPVMRDPDSPAQQEGRAALAELRKQL